MKVEKQGQSECALATIAVLAGTTLEAVRATAYELLATPWLEFCSKCGQAPANDEEYWAALEIVAEFHGGPTLACQWVQPTWDNITCERMLPITGRGTVLITGCGPAHVAAWENGVIHDSNRPDEPGTMEQFVNRYPGLDVHRITVE